MPVRRDRLYHGEIASDSSLVALPKTRASPASPRKKDSGRRQYRERTRRGPQHNEGGRLHGATSHRLVDQSRPRPSFGIELRSTQAGLRLVAAQPTDQIDRVRVVAFQTRQCLMGSSL